MNQAKQKKTAGMPRTFLAVTDLKLSSNLNHVNV